MTIRIVRLGSPRTADEGLRLGTVRHPPRGVPKEQYAARDFYDLWFPNLAPSAELIKAARTAADERAWAEFKKRYRAEMRRPEPSHELDLLAALSHQSNFSLGCYCPEEATCHRSVLRELLLERGALVC